MSESQQLSVQDSGQLSLSEQGFAHIQRVAAMFAASQLVPATFQKNVQNVTVALEMAQRIGCSPLMVMQNLNIIHGKPSFGASFMIATVNACGKFTPLRFTFVGKELEDDWGCYAHATAKFDKAECKGVTITYGMAKAEGWMQKSGSKWKTMPGLMMQYRAATWWTRMYAPELLMGFPTADEVVDITTVENNTTTVEEDAARRKRARSSGGGKGVSGMKTVEPAAPPVTTPPDAEPEKPAAPATTSPDSSSSEAPAEPASTPSQTEPTTPAVGETTSAAKPEPEFDMLPRCEIKGVVDRGSGVSEVTLSGDYNGVAYYRAVADVKFPDVGVLIDAVFKDQPSKRNTSVTVKVIESFQVVA